MKPHGTDICADPLDRGGLCGRDRLRRLRQKYAAAALSRNPTPGKNSFASAFNKAVTDAVRQTIAGLSTPPCASDFRVPNSDANCDRPRSRASSTQEGQGMVLRRAFAPERRKSQKQSGIQKYFASEGALSALLACGKQSKAGVSVAGCKNRTTETPSAGRKIASVSKSGEKRRIGPDFRYGHQRSNNFRLSRRPGHLSRCTADLWLLEPCGQRERT